MSEKCTSTYSKFHQSSSRIENWTSTRSDSVREQMPRFARRGAMPHHHVPEPKETSPTVDRLRLQLNRTVRRTVTEAVDAVWVAFKDELAQLAAPPTAPPVDDYELFYDCCSRLAKFIESNMDTTPGFLEQMDRLIFACHSGAQGPTVRSFMTKDLRILGVDSNSWNGIEAVDDEEKTVDQESFATNAASVFSKCTSDSCESTEVDEGYQTRSKSKEGEKTQSEKPDTTWSEQYTNVIEENDPDTEAVQVEPSEREMASNGKQVRPTAELEPIDVEVAAKANGVAGVDEEIELDWSTKLR
ncbi:hypothetical protein GQ600_15034 [Phytophthora cactorum]|nr:hypothetical protein GQ600_15034 [Phytophthora cactorum]